MLPGRPQLFIHVEKLKATQKAVEIFMAINKSVADKFVKTAITSESEFLGAFRLWRNMLNCDLSFPRKRTYQNALTIHVTLCLVL